MALFITTLNFVVQWKIIRNRERERNTDRDRGREWGGRRERGRGEGGRERTNQWRGMGERNESDKPLYLPIIQQTRASIHDCYIRV